MSFKLFCCCCCCYMSSSNPSGLTSSGSSAVASSTSASSVSGIKAYFTQGGESSVKPLSMVKPSQTFASPAKKTSYGRVMNKRMKFTIYLHRGGLKGSLHDRIVVSSAKYGSVTLELGHTSESGNEIVPVCEQFQGSITELSQEKELECTFRDLTQKADECWRKMGSYDVFKKNCQDFCNHFLKSVGAEPYMTTREWLSENLSAGAATVAALALQ